MWQVAITGQGIQNMQLSVLLIVSMNTIVNIRLLITPLPSVSKPDDLWDPVVHAQDYLAKQEILGYPLISLTPRYALIASSIIGLRHFSFRRILQVFRAQHTF
jgi:hypothetical protein